MSRLIVARNLLAVVSSGRPVKPNAQVASRSGALEPGRTGRQMGGQSTQCARHWPSPSAVDTRKHLHELLDLQSLRTTPPPIGVHALPLPAPASECSSLFPVDDGREQPRPEAQGSSRRGPFLQGDWRSTTAGEDRGLVRLGQVENKSCKVWAGPEVLREWRGL